MYQISQVIWLNWGCKSKTFSRDSEVWNTNFVKCNLYQLCFLEKPLSCVLVRMQPELVSLGGGQEVGSIYLVHCRINGTCWKGTERLKRCHSQGCEQVTVYKLVFVLDTCLMMTGLRGFLICLISGRLERHSFLSTSRTAQLDYKDLFQNQPQNQAIHVKTLYMDVFRGEAASGGVLYLNKPVRSWWNTRTRGQTRHHCRESCGYNSRQNCTCHLRRPLGLNWRK